MNRSVKLKKTQETRLKEVHSIVTGQDELEHQWALLCFRAIRISLRNHWLSKSATHHCSRWLQRQSCMDIKMKLRLLLYIKCTWNKATKTSELLSVEFLYKKDLPFLHATPDFLMPCSCCGDGCGKVKCPLSIENCDFENYCKKDSSCFEMKEGNFLS